MANKNDKLGTAPVGKLLFSLALPSIIAQLVNMLYNIVDRIYIGRIPGVGSTALAGLGVTFPVLMLIAAFSCLVGMGGAPRASIKMGEGDHEGAQRIMGSCFVTLLAFSVILTGVFLVFSDKLLLIFGASADTLPFASGYMKIYVCGTVFVQLALGMNPFISAQGYATSSMLTVLIGAALNIALDPLFIFVFGLGIQGAAIATVISQAVSAVYVVWFLCRRKTKIRLHFRYMRFYPKIMLPVMALGVSPFIMQSTESLLLICFNTSLQAYGGTLAIGAMSILSSVMQVLSMPLMGLTQGAQPIISYNYGAGNNERVRRAFKLLFISAVSFAGIFWLAVMLFPGLFASLFTGDQQLISFASWAMRIYLGTCFMLGIQNACQQTFVALGKASSSLFLALLRKIILLIPLIYIFPLFFEDKVFAVFFAEPVADFLAATTTLIMFLLQFKKILRNNPHHQMVETIEMTPKLPGEDG